MTVAAGKTLRLGTNGGISHTAANTVSITFTGGTLTAGDGTDATDWKDRTCPNRELPATCGRRTARNTARCTVAGSEVAVPGENPVALAVTCTLSACPMSLNAGVYDDEVAPATSATH